MCFDRIQYKHAKIEGTQKIKQDMFCIEICTDYFFSRNEFKLVCFCSEMD